MGFQAGHFRTNTDARSKRAKIWCAARILREFTCEELAAVCEIENLMVVRVYVSLLERAGYLMGRRQGRKTPVRYRLIRNTGPLYPQVKSRARGVYDPNTKQEYTLCPTPTIG